MINAQYLLPCIIIAMAKQDLPLFRARIFIQITAQIKQSHFVVDACRNQQILMALIPQNRSPIAFGVVIAKVSLVGSHGSLHYCASPRVQIAILGAEGSDHSPTHTFSK